ncbi:hypothetical protein B0H10DRAFT_1794657 [Mycena sp. CBHHK59/15]|nr:hypothetical protein B0H10DRAFT_1794657 [Mycena sp. CBHHK59/15]
MPVPVAGANPAAAPPPPVVQQDPVQSSAPQFPVPEPATAAPVRFSGTSHVAFLNYSPHHIIYNGAEYPSAMHLHEALKFLPHNPGFAERIRNCPDVAGVHPLSEELARSSPNAVRPDWAAVYLPLMQEVILQKFKLHADLRAMLLETGDAPLIYADQLDSFWGEGPAGNGHNNLGRILEQVRASLRVEGGLS